MLRKSCCRKTCHHGNLAHHELQRTIVINIRFVEFFAHVIDRLNPYAVDAYDGINLNPLEVVFIKVKGFMLQADWTAPKASQTYDRWLSHKVSMGHSCLATCCIRPSALSQRVNGS